MYKHQHTTVTSCCNSDKTMSGHWYIAYLSKVGY